jgi:hypothetical protein
MMQARRMSGSARLEGSSCSVANFHHVSGAINFAIATDCHFPVHAFFLVATAGAASGRIAPYKREASVPHDR